jgi:hypothetical protein
MGRFQRFGNLYPEIQHLAGFEGRLADPMLESLAGEKLHGDERTSLMLADVVNRADIGVVQSRRRLCLALKTAQPLRIASQILRKKLQSDKAVQARILGFVNHAHTAAAKFFDDSIMGDLRPDQRSVILVYEAIACNLPGKNFDGRRLHKSNRVLFLREERLQFLKKLCIFRASVFKKFSALSLIQRQGLMIQFLDSRPKTGLHG